MRDLVSVRDLGYALRLPLDSDDPYTLLMIGQASNAVRDFTGHQEWVGSEPGVNEEVAPATARDVALWVALRAHRNPLNLERRTAGPISETFRDSGVFGAELTAAEEARLRNAELVSRGSTGGLWVQPVGQTRRLPDRVWVPDPWHPAATPLLVAEGADVAAFISVEEQGDVALNTVEGVDVEYTP